MKYVKYSLTFLFLPMVILAKAQTTKPANINALADLYIDRFFQLFPENGTFFGIEKANNADLSDNSLAGVKKWQVFEDSLLKSLKAIQKAKLNKQDAITYGILQEQLEGDIGCLVCKNELWSANQMSGWQVWFSDLADIQPVGNEANRNSTLHRWKQIPRYIQNEETNLKEGLKLKYTIPKQNVKLVIDQLNDILKQQVADSYFYGPARRDSTSSFAKSLQLIIEQQIYPQIRAYRDFLVNDYLAKAREEISIAAIPDGAACYKALLRSSTTLSATPEEVYNEGVKGVALREEKMKDIGSRLYGTSDLKKIKEHMRSDTSNRFSSKEELVAFSNDAVTRAKAKIPAYFGLVPTAVLEIKPMPDFQRTGFSHYNPAADDGSHPAVYYIQLFQFEKQDKGDVEKTAFHEAYPGHHLQIAIARELVQSHPIVKYIINSGFAEGWARYTETLADEMGLYSSDRNRLSAYAGSPTGMVVDPGIHLKHWTREQAITYTLEKQVNMTRQGAEAYVDRIAVWPGQMTTYGVGESLFLKLRSRAQATLGKQFVLKTFHDKCLELGTVPLNMLEQHISDWLSVTSTQTASKK